MKQWEIAQCRLCGLSHIRNHSACQDEVEVQQNESCIAAALADGIGSLPNSDVAARSATKMTVRWLLEHSEQLVAAEDPAQLIRTAMLNAVADGIRKAAEFRRIDVGTMDCNLAFVCIIRSHNMAIYGHLGDCAVCVLDNNPRVLTEQGGFANGTSTVLYRQADEAIRIRVMREMNESLHGFILVSDGVEGEIYRKNSRLVRQDAQDYFNTVFEAEPGTALKEKLIELQRSGEELFTDDISMIVLSRAAARITLPENPMWLCRCGYHNPLTTSYCEECSGDFLEMYPRAVTRRFGSLDEAMQFFNRNPDEARRVLGISDTCNADAAPKWTQPEAEGQYSDEKDGPDSVTANNWETTDAGQSSDAEKRLKHLMDREQEYVEAIQNRTDGSRVSEDKKSRGFPKKKRIWQRLFAGALIVIMCIMLAISVRLIAGMKEIWDDNKGFFSQKELLEQLGISVNVHPDDVGVLEEKLLEYLGISVNGNPDGFGVLEKDGYFWIGVFKDGKMTGQFMKFSSSDLSDITIVIFPDDGGNPDMEIPLEGVYVVEKPIDFLLYELTPDSEQVAVDLKPGNRIYRTTAEEQEFQGRIYVQIVAGDAKIGWVDKTYIGRSGA